MTQYYAPPGGLPPQTQLMTQRAVFTAAYAFIPKGSRGGWNALTRTIATCSAASPQPEAQIA